MKREAGDGLERRPAELSELVDLVHQDALSMRYFDGVGNLTDAQIRTGLENVARVKRVAEENVSNICNDLRRELTMGDKLALCDNVAMVTGNLSRYLQEKILKDELCPGGAWIKGAGQMMVQLLLQGMKPARFRDVVKLQLACWEDGDSDSPGKLMAIMDAQLNKFEAAEEILGFRISNTGSDKPKDKRQGKDVGQVGKETASKRNGRKSRVNVDDGAKTFWGTCFVCGEQGRKKDRCPTRTESDKKATAQPQRSSSAIVSSAGISTGARLRAPSLASSSASSTRSAVAGKPALSHPTVSVETQEKEEGHADPVQRRPDICPEQIEMLRTELVGTAPDDPHAEAGVTMTHARKMCGVTRSWERA